MSALFQCAFVVLIAMISLLLFAGGGLGRLLEIVGEVVMAVIDLVRSIGRAIIERSKGKGPIRPSESDPGS